MEFKDKTLLKVLKEHYPKCLGLKPQIIGKKKRKAIELGFSTEVACRDALLKEFKIGEKTIEVSKTLASTANVINIGISEIPLLGEEELKPALIKTFESYGDILNIGISNSENSDAAKPTPQVELVGFPKSKLNLVRSQIKPICPDRHTDDHIKFDCPKGKKKLCHRCKKSPLLYPRSEDTI
ncbi:hypothetical protein MAM1_0634c11059 [Mucor ambiguus]|uniref:Uncharacterized protein n=1 Tax=Mucor ambiguus TaxID=91626 RepID=A0A0C9ML16_9FUNG|nr:hypothetical protein MAM1_0634c11059 [Mucor ambiguus]